MNLQLRRMAVIPAMHRFCIICVALSLLAAIAQPLESRERYKTVSILGLRILSEESLVRDLALDRLPAGSPAFLKASTALEEYCHDRGFIIARAYLIRETGEELHIFFDEGRIDKFIFFNLNAINALRMRYEFKLEKSVYNLYTVERGLSDLKSRFRLRCAGAKLISVRNYDNSFFQIDRKFTIPLGGLQKLPFFGEYYPRYDLGIFLERHPPSEEGGIIWGVKSSYTKGLKPYVQYIIPSFFGKNDRLDFNASAGIYYGLDLQFSSPPRFTFMEFSSNYTLPPIFERLFTPAVKAYVYRSWASRKDLGLDEYEYLILRGTLAPGLTVLNKMRVHAGYGIDRVQVYRGMAAGGAAYNAEIAERTDNWCFFETGMHLNLFPWSLRHLIERSFSFTYDYYMNESAFHKFRFDGAIGFEFKNFDILSLHLDSVFILHPPPFYYEESVDNATFKGFMGKSFHTLRIIRASAEYRFSIYRDYVFVGVFADGVAFRGSGYDLIGAQGGIVAGIAGHFIFLDQFEFNIYYGKDFLFSTGESQYNVYVSFEKKW